MFAFIEQMKQLNKGDQLTNVWFSYNAIASSFLLIMAMCSIGADIVLELTI